MFLGEAPLASIDVLSFIYQKRKQYVKAEIKNTKLANINAADICGMIAFK